MKKKKILLTAGIRPDGNKISPLYLKFKEYPKLFDTVLVNTGQHADLLSEMFKIFKIDEDYNLKTMKSGQSIFQITTKMLEGLGKVIDSEKPDIVFAPNDGTTTLVTALAAYYHKIPVAHVESGLRTYDIYNPHPEEGNRRMTSCLTSLHFAPTLIARKNLIGENYDPGDIFVSGNTVIDALYWVIKRFKDHPFSDNRINNLNFQKNKVLILTTHRRENWGKPMKDALGAIKKIAKEHKDVRIVFPVHPNPVVREVASDTLGRLPNVILTDPLSYIEMTVLISKCNFIISDSGGIQEEAPSFGKPLLVMRKTTERPEGVTAGIAKLVGTDPELILKESENLLTNESIYKKMSLVKNPYGDGNACERIVQKTGSFLGLHKNTPEEFNPDD